MEHAVGQSITRLDAVSKVTGSATYGSDFSRPGMLHAKILFSDIPHARIISVNYQSALALRGVHAVVTSQDTINKPYGGYLQDKLIFAADRIRHIGEPIAAVAADTDSLAKQALELIEVEYEELESIFSLEDALKDDAPILHPDVGSYACAFPYQRYGNVCMDSTLIVGDLEKGFSEADVIIEETYQSKAMHQGYLEPYACVADFDHNQTLTIWTTTQQLSVCHKEIAAGLGMSMNEVRVIPLWMGGAFGGKLGSRYEHIAALLTKKTGKPVRLALSREEDFIASHGRAPYTMKLKGGVTRDGKITAWQSEIMVDAGAYSDEALGATLVALGFSMGPYRITNCTGRARTVYTNNPDWGCMRGYGGLQIGYAMESHLDILAAEIDMDPAEMRLKNLAKEGDLTITGQPLHSVSIQETMDAALEASDYFQRKKALKPNQGIGIANHMGESGLLGSSAVIRMNEDATLTVLTATVDLGTGTHTALCQIVAQVLDIPVDIIKIAAPDSDNSPYDIGTFASKTIYDAGNAVRLAAEDLRADLVQLAADVFSVDPDEIHWNSGEACLTADPEIKLSLQDLAGISLYVRGGPLLGKGSRVCMDPFNKPPGEGYGNPPTGSFLFGTHVVEVEVDPDTGKCKILNYVACHDVGKAINPMGVEGQIEGGVAQGIGYGLSEEMLVKDGRILNPSFSGYIIPTAMDIPKVQPVIVEVPDPAGPFGAKGVGEPPNVIPMPALVNAIFDATGAKMKEIPITAERLLDALRSR